jgi:hypothetical protein
MHTPDELPQNPILHLVTFGENVRAFKTVMTAEPEDWRHSCRTLQDAWARLANVDIQRLSIDALNRIRSLRENQNKIYRHDGRSAPSAYDLAMFLWVDFRHQQQMFTSSFQWALEQNEMLGSEDWVALSRRYDIEELMKIGVLIDAEFKYADRCYLIDTLPLLQREIFNQLSEDGEATRSELRTALQGKVENGSIKGAIATSDKPICEAVKNLKFLKLIRELQDSYGILQINS